MAKVLLRHVGTALGSLNETVEVTESVTPRRVEMRVEGSNFITKCSKGRRGTLERWQSAPGLVFSSCVTTRPKYLFLIRGRCAISEFVNIVKECLKAEVIGCKPWGVSAKRQGPMDSHDSSVGTRAEGFAREMWEVWRCW